MRAATLFALAVTPLLALPTRTRLGPEPRVAPSLTVTTDWLAAHLDDPDLVILEVSEDIEYRRGHIRRARPIDVMAFHAHGDAMLPVAQLIPGLEALGVSNSSRIVLYGDYMSTSVLWVVLEYLGMGDQTLVLDGGKAAWTAAGKPLSTEAPTYLAGKLVPGQRDEIFTNAALITLQLRDPRLALIDARSAEEFGGGSGNETSSPGHIPGAVNLDWHRTVDSSGALLPEEKLRDLFTRAGYASGDQLVVYCTVGMRASHLYFVARHLGLRPQLYLGSMNDWLSDPSRLVVRGASN
jgi:thiosulfate/3-mercaptopyruvate sulfurtransferase